MFDKFLYGVAASAFQIEGDDGTQGRGKSIWDTFSEIPGITYKGQNATVAADHYNRWEEDLDLMKDLGVNCYRFSVGWPRIFPDGTGKINQKGVDFYSRLIDGLLKRDILPILTFYHWDMPVTLHEKGGMQNPDFSDWFGEYAEFLVKKYGDRVKDYITFNEPIPAVDACYRTGYFAPGLKLKDEEVLKCVHHMLLAHGKATRAIAENVKDFTAGVAIATFEEYPSVLTEKCINAAKEHFFTGRDAVTETVGIYTDPIYAGVYPERVYREFPRFRDYVKDGDLKLISENSNVVFYNNYGGKPYDENGNLDEAKLSKNISDLGTYVDPNGIYWGAKFFYERYKKPVVISENGMACNDGVHDARRVQYFKDHLAMVEKLQKEIDLKGYLVWSLLDNFEWREGYSQRFGLVDIDFDTLKRTPKDSFNFYKEYIKTHKN